MITFPNLHEASGARAVVYKAFDDDLVSCGTVDVVDTLKAVDQMEGFLKSVDQNVDQAPSKAKEG